MKTTLSFETIVHDRIYFDGGKIIPDSNSYPLFTTDDTETENCVTDTNEEAILKFFMASSAVGFLFNHLRLPPNSFFAFSVEEPVRINSNHPDFDLIICEPDKPEFSTAIQCKRVKVFAQNEYKDKVNKLGSVGQIVKQANIQREKYGFHQNYLAIIIQTFGKNRVNENALFRNSTNQTFQEIYEFPQRESVHPDVGIIFIRITQPTGRNYEDQSSIGVCFDRLANRLPQTDNLTNRIKDLVLQNK